MSARAWFSFPFRRKISVLSADFLLYPHTCHIKIFWLKYTRKTFFFFNSYMSLNVKQWKLCLWRSCLCVSFHLFPPSFGKKKRMKFMMKNETSLSRIEIGSRPSMSPETINPKAADLVYFSVWWHWLNHRHMYGVRLRVFLLQRPVPANWDSRTLSRLRITNNRPTSLVSEGVQSVQYNFFLVENQGGGKLKLT